MDLGLTGKVALVVAASKGLGRGCALALAREGAHVAICARSEADLAAAAADIRAATGAQGPRRARQCRQRGRHSRGRRGYR